MQLEYQARFFVGANVPLFKKFALAEENVPNTELDPAVVAPSAALANKAKLVPE
jgi:hypothetical protein